MRGSIKFQSETYTRDCNVSGTVDVHLSKRSEATHLELKLIFTCEEIVDAEVLSVIDKNGNQSDKSTTFADSQSYRSHHSPPAIGGRSFDQFGSRRVCRSIELAHKEVILAEFKDKIPSGDFKLPFTFRLPDNVAPSLSFSPAKHSTCQVKNNVALMVCVNENPFLLANGILKIVPDPLRIRGSEATTVEEVIEVPSSKFFCFGQHDGQFIVQASCDSRMTKKVLQPIVQGLHKVYGRPPLHLASLDISLTMVNASKRKVNSLNWRLVSISRLGCLNAGLTPSKLNNLPMTLHATTLASGTKTVECPGPRTTSYDSVHVEILMEGEKGEKEGWSKAELKVQQEALLRAQNTIGGSGTNLNGGNTINSFSGKRLAVPDYNGHLFGVSHRVELEFRLQGCKNVGKLVLPVRLLGENDCTSVNVFGVI